MKTIGRYEVIRAVDYPDVKRPAAQRDPSYVKVADANTFLVRVAGATEAISEHAAENWAEAAAKRYDAADRRHART